MMIGRDDQLRQILETIEERRFGASGPNVLFVTGEAGIGKSTLLAATAGALGDLPDSPIVAMVACSTPLAGQDIGEVEALQPWAEIMTRLASSESPRRSVTRKLVGEIAMAWVGCIPVVGDVLDSAVNTARIVSEHRRPAGSADRSASPVYAASQQQIFQQYINVLGRLSESAPVVLMIDDFHWSDTSSTNLLFAAARDLQQKPVTFVIAYRPDDAATSRAGEGHPILQIRNELERYGLSLGIGVPGMSARDIDELLHERYRDYRNDDRFEQWLAEVGAGNALFITQFLSTLEEEGLIDRVNGRIHEGYRSVTVPRSAQAVFEQRLRRMDEETRELLRYASVEGTTFTALMLSKLLEIPQLKLLQKLRLVEETHQVVKSLGKQLLYLRESTAYRFAHALLHRTVYESLGEEERELLHEAIFDELRSEWESAQQQGGALRSIALRLAAHAVVLHEHLFAAELLLAGARESWREYAAEETLRQIEQSLANLDDAEAHTGADRKRSIELRAEAMMAQGRVHDHAGMSRQALESYQAAAGLFAEIDDRLGDIEARNRIARLHLLQGEYAIAEEIATRALDDARREGDWKGEAEALLRSTNIAEFHGDSESALGHAQMALEIYERHDDRAGAAAALFRIGALHLSFEGPATALRYLEQACDLFTAIGDRCSEADALTSRGVTAMQTGDSVAALELYKRALEIQMQLGDRRGEARSMMTIAVTYYYMGDLAGAISYFETGSALAEEQGNQRHLAFALRGLGIAHRDMNHIDIAADCFHRSLAIDRELADRASEGATLFCLASIEQLHGNHAEALDYLLRSLEIAESISSQELMADALGSLGDLHVDMDQPQQGLDYLQRALDLFRTNGDRAGELLMLIKAGRALRVLGRLEESRQALESSIAMARAGGFESNEAAALGQLGLLVIAEGVEGMQEGMALIGQCIGIYARTGDVERKRWEKELERLQGGECSTEAPRA